jgi:hypothetical protein
MPTFYCLLKTRIKLVLCPLVLMFPRNMTKSPKPKQDENGNYIKNGARAKAGLNRAILDSAWGKVKLYTTYKAKRTEPNQ